MAYVQRSEGSLGFGSVPFSLFKRIASLFTPAYRLAGCGLPGSQSPISFSNILYEGWDY